MTATLTPQTQPGDAFELKGRALVIRNDAAYYKHQDGVLHVKGTVEVDGQTRYFDLRILDDTARWFNDAAKVIDAIDNPQPKPAPKSKKVEKGAVVAEEPEPAPKPSLVPDDPDQMTVAQLRGFANAHGILLPKDGKKAVILAAVKNGIREQREAAAAQAA